MKTIAGNLWERAGRVAARAPSSRDRYVDALRALSILAVVLGHWLVAAPYLTGDGLRAGHLLQMSPWSQWLTWLFQVMPLFFLVGGYAHAASWESTRRRGLPYGQWLTERLRRLFAPVVPLVALWVVVIAVGSATPLDPSLLARASQAALVPLWFLAVYVGVAALVPLSQAAWSRWGWGSFWSLATAAIAADLLGRWGAGGLRWLNYGLVWLAVHQLGYAWREGRLDGPRRALPWAAGGLLALVMLVTAGPYPVSMVGVPGAATTNTGPPTPALLALGVAQAGVALALAGPARRLLRRAAAWRTTVLVNSVIMTIYLWHLTVMVAVIGIALAAGGPGLHAMPGTASWWALRPLWLALMGIVLAVLLVPLAAFEHPMRSRVTAPPALWRPLAATVAGGAGLAVMVLAGISGGGWLGLRWEAVLLTAAGALLVGAHPVARPASPAPLPPR